MKTIKKAMKVLDETLEALKKEDRIFTVTTTITTMHASGNPLHTVCGIGWAVSIILPDDDSNNVWGFVNADDSINYYHGVPHKIKSALSTRIINSRRQTRIDQREQRKREMENWTSEQGEELMSIIMGS